LRKEDVHSASEKEQLIESLALISGRPVNLIDLNMASPTITH